MARLSRLLSSFLLGACISLSANAYIPQDIPEYRQLLIKQGHHAPYNELTVQRVIVGKAQIMPNGAIVNLPHGPEFVPSLDELRNNPKWQEKETWSNNIQLDMNLDPMIGWTDKQKRFIDTLFWSAQILDIYSTYRGLQYDCIREKNPLLDDVPQVQEMIGLKFLVIGGIRKFAIGHEDFWYGWKFGAGTTTALVTANNFRLLRKAQKKCDRR